jgi:hypothetical protein
MANKPTNIQQVSGNSYQQINNYNYATAPSQAQASGAPSKEDFEKLGRQLDDLKEIIVAGNQQVVSEVQKTATKRDRPSRDIDPEGVQQNLFHRAGIPPEVTCRGNDIDEDTCVTTGSDGPLSFTGATISEEDRARNSSSNSISSFDGNEIMALDCGRQEASSKKPAAREPSFRGNDIDDDTFVTTGSDGPRSFTGATISEEDRARNSSSNSISSFDGNEIMALDCSRQEASNKKTAAKEPSLLSPPASTQLSESSAATDGASVGSDSLVYSPGTTTNSGTSAAKSKSPASDRARQETSNKKPAAKEGSVLPPETEAGLTTPPPRSRWQTNPDFLSPPSPTRRSMSSTTGVGASGGSDLLVYSPESVDLANSGTGAAKKNTCTSGGGANENDDTSVAASEFTDNTQYEKYFEARNKNPEIANYVASDNGNTPNKASEFIANSGTGAATDSNYVSDVATVVNTAAFGGPAIVASSGAAAPTPGQEEADGDAATAAPVPSTANSGSGAAADSNYTSDGAATGGAPAIVASPGAAAPAPGQEEAHNDTATAALVPSTPTPASPKMSGRVTRAMAKKKQEEELKNGSSGAKETPSGAKKRRGVESKQQSESKKQRSESKKQRSR